MPSTADYIEKIAELGDERDLGEEVAKKVDALDPLMIGDDALTHFGYTGADEPDAKGEYLRNIRSLLEIRFDEVESLGHKPEKMTLVAIDKLLSKLDLLVELDAATGVRSLISGEMKDLVHPATILPKIDADVEAVDKAAEAITTALGDRKFGDMEQALKNFDEALSSLKNEIGSIKNQPLKKHLTDVLCETGNAFSIGETYRTARTAVENKVTTALSYAWNDAWKIAEDSFSYFTESAGKKLPLSAAVKIDPSFQKALTEIDEKSKKGEDISAEKEKAGQLGEATLKTIENMPEKLKKAEPSFFGKLQSSVWGIMTTLKG